MGPSAASGSTRSRTTPARTPARCGAPAAPSWPRGRSATSPTQGWAGAGLLEPGVGHGRDHLCGVVPHDPGHYAAHLGRASSAVTNGPLTALANGGVYAYGSSTTFPSSTFNGSNYWVDVVYTPLRDRH